MGENESAHERGWTKIAAILHGVSSTTSAQGTYGCRYAHVPPPNLKHKGGRSRFHLSGRV
eukprot:1220054-Prymnesium_polylepis.1